jgi:hypothetical protein
MDEREPPTRRASVIRLLAAALAGAIGAFGLPAGAHNPQATTSVAAIQPPSHSPDPSPE